MGKLRSIQQLRGFAALAVVLFHFSGAGGGVWKLHGGAAGVDVFFVISGFVMWLVTDKAPTPQKFLTDRALRIIPLYWLATLIIGVLNHPPAADMIRSMLFVPFDGPVGRFPVLLPGWTLNLEMFFYLVFAAGLMLPRRSQLLFLGVVLTSLCALGYVLHPAAAIPATFTHPLLIEFFSGVLLCEAWRRGWVKHAHGWALVAVGLAAFAVLEAARVDCHDTPLRPLLWGLPALLVVTGFVAMEAAGRRVTLPLFERLGDASYSLYLFHLIVLSLLLKVVPASPLVFLIGVPTSLAVGWIAYRLAETPMLAVMKPRPRAMAA